MGIPKERSKRDRKTIPRHNEKKFPKFGEKVCTYQKLNKFHMKSTPGHKKKNGQKTNIENESPMQLKKSNYHI